MSESKSPDRETELKLLSRRDAFKLAGAVGVVGLGLSSAADANAEVARLKVKAASLGKISVRLYRQASSAPSASSRAASASSRAASSSSGAELLETLDLSSLVSGKAKGQYSLRLYNVREKSEELLSEQVLEIAEPPPSK
jgi:hypothetical protein